MTRYLVSVLDAMGAAALRSATWVELRWVAILTAFAPAAVRERHRGERIAHLADHLEDDWAAGYTPLHTAGRIFLRFLVGLPADILFSLQQSVLHAVRSREAIMFAAKRSAIFGVLFAAMLFVVATAPVIMGMPKSLLDAGYAQTIVAPGPALIAPAAPGPNGPTGPGVTPPGPNGPGPFGPEPCPKPICDRMWMMPGGPHRVLVMPGPKALGGVGEVFAGLGWLLQLAFMVTLIVLAWRISSIVPRWAQPDGATRLLRERYARGEIDDDEFGRRLAALR